MPTLREYVDYDFMSGHYPSVVPWNAKEGRKATLSECCASLVDKALELKDAVAAKDAEIAALRAELGARGPSTRPPLI